MQRRDERRLASLLHRGIHDASTNGGTNASPGATWRTRVNLGLGRARAHNPWAVNGPSTVVRVRVVPGAHRSEVVGRYGTGWKVRLAAPPERGKANAALIEVLADALAVSRASVEIVGGHASRNKVVAFAGVSAEEAGQRLQHAAVAP